MTETVWQFDTTNFRVKCEFLPEYEDPADCFDDPRDVAMVRNDEVLWFTAKVSVEHNGHEIGTDYLGCCAYGSIDEFIASHRDSDPMNRNSTIYRKAKGENHAICHYFPSMVHQAIADARKTINLPR